MIYISKFIDKTGKKFNMLIAKKYLGGGWWLCDCECGNKNVKILSSLLNEVKGRNKQKSCGCLIEKNKPKVQDFFKEINDEYKAYILGFIAADGSILKKGNKIKIDLKEDDSDILLKIQKAIGHTNKLYYYQQENIKFKGSDKIYTAKTVRLVINSKEMVEDLEKYGVTQNKTDALNINLDLIPDDLFFHFLRGMIDGDGCISFSEEKKYQDLSLTTSTIMANKIIDWLNQKYEFKNYFILTHRRKENKNNATLITTKKTYINNVLDSLYEGSKIFLERKYKKYLDFKKFYNSND